MKRPDWGSILLVVYEETCAQVLGSLHFLSCTWAFVTFSDFQLLGLPVVIRSSGYSGSVGESRMWRRGWFANGRCDVALPVQQPSCRWV